MTTPPLSRPSPALCGAIAAVTFTSLTIVPVSQAVAQSQRTQPRTPIEHVIMIIGENRTFDHVFATYTPRAGETVNNLLSEGIVKADGTPGPNFSKAAQNSATDTTTYMLSPPGQTPYAALPPAMTDGAPSSASDESPPPFATLAAATAAFNQINDGLPTDDYKLQRPGQPDCPATVSIPASRTRPHCRTDRFSYRAGMPYDSYTASPVHRFYQMWQQLDCSVTHATAGQSVRVALATCSRGWKSPSAPAATASRSRRTSPTRRPAKARPRWASTTCYRATCPTSSSWRTRTTISDNFHQSIEGGTGANHIAARHRPGDLLHATATATSPTPPAQRDRESESAARHQQLVHPGRLQRRLLQQLLRPNAARASTPCWTTSPPAVHTGRPRCAAQAPITC